MLEATDNTVVVYIFVNNDLKMGKGKIAGQVGHVVQYITEDLVKEHYEGRPNSSLNTRYKKWNEYFCAKIVMKATEEQLRELMKLPETKYVLDAGKTQIAPNSLTAVGFFPNSKANMYHITRHYKLL